LAAEILDLRGEHLGDAQAVEGKQAKDRLVVDCGLRGGLEQALQVLVAEDLCRRAVW
jgi:hypothetical protein